MENMRPLKRRLVRNSLTAISISMAEYLVGNIFFIVLIREGAGTFAGCQSMPSFNHNMKTDKVYCIVGYDWFMDRPMRWYVSFQVLRGLQTVARCPAE